MTSTRLNILKVGCALNRHASLRFGHGMSIAKSLHPPSSAAPSLVVPDRPDFVISQQAKDFFYPTIGNRDVVGFGSYGEPEYFDEVTLPFPAIRFSENTAEFMALREKEKGDWKQLSIDEKKKLYRFNFCRTYAEMCMPTGTWRTVLSFFLFVSGTTLLFSCFILHKVYHGYGPGSLIYPDSYDPDVLARQLETQVRLHANPLRGIASKYDYDREEFKANTGFFTGRILRQIGTDIKSLFSSSK